MANIFGVIFLITIGFMVGWRYGYREVTNDVERIIRRALEQRRRG